MQDFVPPPIVQPNQNGRDYLIALCNLFDAPFDEIPEELQNPALQLFTGLYIFPAIEGRRDRAAALNELDDLCNEYFPLSEIEGLWPHIKDGLALNWGSQGGTIRGSYYRVRAEMIVYHSKWRRLTMGNPDDLVTGYRWRRIVTGLFEMVVGIVGAGVAYGSIDGVLGKGVENAIASQGNAPKRIADGFKAGGQRLMSGGSGVIQAATKGRGVVALGSRGGAMGLLGVYVFGHMYSAIKDEEDDIRDAITLRVLSGEIDEIYLDDINGPIDVIHDIMNETWWEE